MKKKIISIIAGFTCILCIAQDMKSNLYKNLEANVGYICEETTEDDPCAGSQIYLTLFFNSDEVVVSEKNITTCGKESIRALGKYKWVLVDKTKINIAFDPERIKYTYAQNLSLEIKENNLIGTVKHFNNMVKEYIFKEKNKSLSQIEGN